MHSIGLPFSSPKPCSAGRALARETKGSGDKGFPVPDSRTSGLHVCSRDVSMYCMGESLRILLPLKTSLFQTANKKNSNLIKNPMSSEPFVSSTKAPPAKRSEKDYGDENVDRWVDRFTDSNSF